MAAGIGALLGVIIWGWAIDKYRADHPVVMPPAAPKVSGASSPQSAQPNTDAQSKPDIGSPSSLSCGHKVLLESEYLSTAPHFKPHEVVYTFRISHMGIFERIQPVVVSFKGDWPLPMFRGGAVYRLIFTNIGTVTIRRFGLMGWIYSEAPDYRSPRDFTIVIDKLYPSTPVTLYFYNDSEYQANIRFEQTALSDGDTIRVVLPPFSGDELHFTIQPILDHT